MNAYNYNRYQIISSSARVFKPIAIFCIAFGHFYDVSKIHIGVLDYWWNISSIALIYFTISSAYFTGIKYNDNLEVKKYIVNKVYRIGIKLVLANLFISLLSIARGRDGIFNAYSIVHFLGLSGFLNWFNIPNHSRLGAGMWFLTLLFIFYAAYPILRKIYQDKTKSIVFTFISLLILIVLDKKIRMGHMLWITMSGYFIGLFFSRQNLTHWVGCIKNISLLFIVIISHVILNILNIKLLNGSLLIAAATMIFILSSNLVFYTTIVNIFRPLDSCIFEIFIIHSYLFFYPTDIFVLNCIISFSIIIFIAIGLNFISKKIVQIMSIAQSKSASGVVH